MNDDAPYWCDEHARAECGETTRKGRCHQPGNETCWRHRSTELAIPEPSVHVDAYSVGLQGPVTPRIGIILMLQVSWARWQHYARLLAEQIEEAKGADTGTKAARGLVGATYDASPAAGGIFPTGETPRALVEIEAAERRLFISLCKDAHAMGVEEHEWLNPT